MTAWPHEMVLSSCLLVMVAYKIAMEDSCIGIVQYVYIQRYWGMISGAL